MPAMLPSMGRASSPTDAGVTGAGGGVVVVSLGGAQERKMRVESGQGRTPAGIFPIIPSSSFVAFGIKSWMIIFLPVDRPASINQYTHTQLFLTHDITFLVCPTAIVFGDGLILLGGHGSVVDTGNELSLFFLYKLTFETVSILTFADTPLLRESLWRSASASPSRTLQNKTEPVKQTTQVRLRVKLRASESLQKIQNSPKLLKRPFELSKINHNYSPLCE